MQQALIGVYSISVLFMSAICFFIYSPSMFDSFIEILAPVRVARPIITIIINHI